MSRESYEAFLRKRFFEPLGMKDTGVSLAESLDVRAAVGYTGEPGALYTFGESPRFDDRNATVVFGAGQIYSTVQDLARWDRALVGEAALASPQRDLLFAPNLANYACGWVIQTRADIRTSRSSGITGRSRRSASARTCVEKRFGEADIFVNVRERRHQA